MLMAHKIALQPNNAQATHLTKACGWRASLTTGPWRSGSGSTRRTRPPPGSPSPRNWPCAVSSMRVKRERFPWMLEVSKNVPQMAIIQLGQAFQNFFAGRARYPFPQERSA